jgi:hypothetical protein
VRQHRRREGEAASTWALRKCGFRRREGGGGLEQYIGPPKLRRALVLLPTFACFSAPTGQRLAGSSWTGLWEPVLAFGNLL